ncbi:4052_t:CDS:2 [Diversispora eburnea]|uniref:4052_t:CDS:1 n=1 Tax=Diversispora eburnea TaxID=1213867 RepID=A0A9N9A1H6_9GLOM|nr:4052_t:CDS:2 [Diversispora eburnea]
MIFPSSSSLKLLSLLSPHRIIYRRSCTFSSRSNKIDTFGFNINNKIKCQFPHSPLLLLLPQKKMNNNLFSTTSNAEVREPLLPYINDNNNNSSLITSRRKFSTSSNNSNDDTSPTSEELKRWSWVWWKEWTIIFIVFGITGSTTVRLVRPLLNNVLGIEEGPWSYRFSYLSITLPLYSIILICVGTLFRRQQYFKKIVFRMYGRFIPNKLVNRISNKVGNRNGTSSTKRNSDENL